MTSPVSSPLIPTLTGRQLSVDYALNQPAILRNQIAKLADPQILLPKLFRQFGRESHRGSSPLQLDTGQRFLHLRH
jgi:hypothetical protein